MRLWEVIDDGGARQLSGACLNQGTVPSKALRSAILDMTGFGLSPVYQ